MADELMVAYNQATGKVASPVLQSLLGGSVAAAEAFPQELWENNDMRGMELMRVRIADLPAAVDLLRRLHGGAV